ncbi:hypothetical protein ISN44_As03g023970 [Arabidopsis suecica]|uniref:Uncharacterized protein n=1 Tax=Arabidopsis suecica TaxID=45249 RepID=A0A8T2F7G7_ARASU|nr:hypothetical protein ISN44_As03g023970 [Arabidopsis suecica]
MNLAGKRNIPVIISVSVTSDSYHRRHVFREHRRT